MTALAEQLVALLFDGTLPRTGQRDWDIKAAPRRIQVKALWDVGRRTRLRWLGCGRQGDMQWDAILAPTGCPLPEYVRSEGALDWSEARPLLLELAGELVTAGSLRI